MELGIQTSSSCSNIKQYETKNHLYYKILFNIFLNQIPLKNLQGPAVKSELLVTICLECSEQVIL